MSTPRRARLISAGLLGLVFLCGVLTGYAADAVVGGGEAPVGSEMEREEDRQAWLIERVGLTDEQRARVDSVVERYRGEIGEMVEACRESYRSLVAESRSEVEAVLTPEQRSEYRSLLEKKRQRGEYGDGTDAAAGYDH